jgi:hypothetical protein
MNNGDAGERKWRKQIKYAYLDVILGSRGKWEKAKKHIAIKGKIRLNRINIYVTSAP